MKKQKNIDSVVDALSCLEIYSLKIQEETEETLTILSWSGDNSISNIN
jgi:hypothetical protein